MKKLRGFLFALTIATLLLASCSNPAINGSDLASVDRAITIGGTTATWYLLETAGTPSGLGLSQSKGSVTGWQPTRALSTTPLIWYSPVANGSYGNGTYTLTIWSSSPGAASPVKAEIIKTNTSGSSVTVLGSAQVDINATGSGNHTSKFVINTPAVTFTNELVGLRLTLVSGKTATIAFNSNDFNSVLSYSGSTVPSATPSPSATATPTVTATPGSGYTYTGTLPNGLINNSPVSYTSTASFDGTTLTVSFNAGSGFSWVNLYSPGDTAMTANGNVWTAKLAGYKVGQTFSWYFVAGKNGQQADNSSAKLSWIISTGTIIPTVVPTITPTPTTTPTVAPSTLIPLNNGAQMTFQFKNKTAGKYADSSIYVLMIARNAAKQFCYLDKTGNLIPCVSGQNASSYSIKLSDFTGYQFPKLLDSGRLYISLGSPLDIKINTTIDGNVGIAFPNIEDTADANYNKVFEWVEFAVLNNEIWCNTTQVDMFGFPMSMELYTGSSTAYSLFDKVGVEETWASIRASWTATMPAVYQSLMTSNRILAPIHGGFRAGQANGTYFDSYTNSVWSQYTNSNLVITIPQGTFTGRVSGNRLAFTRPGDATVYYVTKPTSEEIWGGMGSLATGNTIELVLEAQICAAFHRHVMDNAANFNNPAAYYKAGPADYFSKFWHDHSINAKAYGFCYDDVNDQSSTVHSINPRGIILNIIW